MDTAVVDRRRDRRVNMEVEGIVRTMQGKNGMSDPVVCRVTSLSLSGFYAFMPGDASLPLGSAVSFSVSIPRESTKQFPFVRVLGRGWVARVDQTNRSSKSKPRAQGATPPQEVGLAIAFTRDAIALASVGTG